MTSDDTKVDTRKLSALDLPSAIFGRSRYTIKDQCGIIGEFNYGHHRDEFLLAIQSLPKVTAERDEAVQQRNTLGQLAYETAEQRDVALSEVSALSARVRELEAENNRLSLDMAVYRDAHDTVVLQRDALITTLRDVRERCLFADDDGSIGVTSEPHIDEEMFDRICALIGKEPS